MKQLIEKFIDRAAFEADRKFASDQLAILETQYTQLKQARINLQGSTGMKAVSENAELTTKANARLAESLKAVNTLINQRFASEAKLVTVQTDYAKATAANNVQLQKQNKELKDQAAYNAANTGSIEKARAAVALLNTERNKLNLYTKEGQARQAELNAQIDKYNGFIKKSVDALSQQKINVGNYQGSAKIIVDALEKERQKLKELEAQQVRVNNLGARSVVTGFGTNQGKTSGPDPKATAEFKNLQTQIDASRKAVEGFSRLTDQPTFLNIASKVGDANQELRFFTKSLIDLERNGLGSSDAAKTLRKSLAELTDQISDAKAEVKALSSDTRGFDLFAGSVSFAADAFQTFAGAAVLAGASEQDAAEATKTLVAVQSVANGVKGIANELTTRGTAANKLYAFAQNQISVAMDGTAAAGARLKAIMVTIGFGALIVAIGLLIANFSKIKDAITGTTSAQKAYNETLIDYRKGAQEAIEKTNSVKLAFNQAKEGVISKDEALKIYNDTLGDTFGKAASLAEAERLYTEKAGTYIKIMGLKAQANALFAKSAEEAAKGITAGNEDNTGGFFDGLLISAKAAFGTDGVATEIAKAQVEGTKKIIKTSEENQKSLFEAGSKLASEAEKLSTALNINTDPTKPVKTKAAKKDTSAEDALKERLESAKREAAALKSIALQSANEIIRINQSVADAEGSSLKDRILSLDEISNQKKKIAAIEFDDAVANEVKIENGKIVVIKKSAKEIEAATVEHSNKVNAINDELLKGQQAAQKANTEKIKSEYDRLRDAKIEKLDEETDALRDADQKQYNDAVISLNARFENGKISQEKYNEERAKLDANYQIKSLLREIAYQRKLIEISVLPIKEKEAALRKLSDLEKQLSDASVAGTQSANAKKLADILKFLDKVKEVSGQVFSFIDGLLNANEISQKNKLKEQSDDAEKKASRDIELINASADSEEKKAAKIAIVNARLAAQKEQIAQKEKRAEMERARFAKAVAIFNIILSTTQAIIKAFTEGDPYTKIARAIAAGASGAAQLAIAISTPVPKFKHGKNSNYQGLGIVDDGGYNEPIYRADTGQVEMSTGKPKDRITFLKRDDLVFPSHMDLMHKMAMPAIRTYSGNGLYQAQSFERIEQALKMQTPLLKQIANKRENHLSVKEGALVSVWMHGASMSKYLQENTDW